ncbi:MAG: hypothetical protein J5I94_10160 [Phaeodactylibacter sp.]|nr:hypothetical protein [Phaeodactylibacter sp.]
MKNRHLTPLFLLALLAVIVFSCMTEKTFYKQYANNEALGIRTTSVSEILQNAAMQEALECEKLKENCGPAKAQLDTYRSRYASYVNKVEQYAALGPICPCDTIATGACIWSKDALQSFVIDEPILELRVENSRGKLHFLESRPKNMVSDEKEFLSYVEFPGAARIEEDTVFVIVRKLGDGKEGIIEKSMMVCPGCLK